MDPSLPFYLSYGALWILVIVQSLILLGLVRIVYQLQRNGATASLTEGQEAPKFSAVSLAGAPIRGMDMAGRMTALLFVSPTCSACKITLADDMDYLRYKAQGNVILICRAGRDDCVRLVKEYKIDLPTVADEDDQLSQLFGIYSVPTAVLINENNRIQSIGQPKREKQVEENLPKAPEARLQGVE